MCDPIIFIMAGGLGKRMYSDIPKVLHEVQNKPMLVHVIENSWKLLPKKIVIIVGKYREMIESTIIKYLPSDIFENLEFAIQPDAKGTGNAILCGLNHISNTNNNNNNNTPVLILSGDTPLIKYETMNLLLQNLNTAKIMSISLINPNGYGRVILKDNRFQKIIEHKDCNNNELLIKNVNTGIYAVTLDLLKEYIPKINNNNSQKEFYLTDLFSLLTYDDIIVDVYNMPSENYLELSGVNTKEQLENLNKLLKDIHY